MRLVHCVAAAALAATVIFQQSEQAKAHWHGGGAFVGGLVAGAVLGGAAAAAAQPRPYYYYGYGPGYPPPPPPPPPYGYAYPPYCGYGPYPPCWRR